MDATIKETLKAVQLYSTLSSSTSFLKTFVDSAVIFATKGKSNSLANPAQIPFFAIHLSCLKNSVEFDHVFLQKKSTLDPKLYQSGLISLLKVVGPSAVINAETVSKYYGCPSMQKLIEDVQVKSKDQSVEGVIATLYLIGQATKLNSIGNLKKITLLWAQSTDVIKEVSESLKVHCDKEKLKDYGKILGDEIKKSKAVSSISELSQKRLANPGSSTTTKRSCTTRSQTASPTKSSAIHPLSIFNCSSKGPAFGPIIF